MYVALPLAPEHDSSGFDSGEPDLDDWLRMHAVTVQQRGIGRTFVLVDAVETSRVVAYYTLAAHVIEQKQLPKKVGRGLPRQLPAVLLGRLALDKSLHGKGLGGAALAEAASHIAQISYSIDARFVVDAISPSAASFYEHHGFTRAPDQDSTGLVQRII